MGFFFFLRSSSWLQHCVYGRKADILKTIEHSVIIHKTKLSAQNQVEGSNDRNTVQKKLTCELSIMHCWQSIIYYLWRKNKFRKRKEPQKHLWLLHVDKKIFVQRTSSFHCQLEGCSARHQTNWRRKQSIDNLPLEVNKSVQTPQSSGSVSLR